MTTTKIHFGMCLKCCRWNGWNNIASTLFVRLSRLVAAFDRMARSTRHFLQVMDELNDLGIEFICVWRHSQCANRYCSMVLFSQEMADELNEFFRPEQ